MLLPEASTQRYPPRNMVRMDTYGLRCAFGRRGTCMKTEAPPGFSALREAGLRAWWGWEVFPLPFPLFSFFPFFLFPPSPFPSCFPPFLFSIFLFFFFFSPVLFFLSFLFNSFGVVCVIGFFQVPILSPQPQPRDKPSGSCYPLSRGTTVGGCLHGPPR